MEVWKLSSWCVGGAATVSVTPRPDRAEGDVIKRVIREIYLKCCSQTCQQFALTQNGFLPVWGFFIFM